MKVENKNPKKPLVFYYLIAMIVLMLLNALVFPSLMTPHVTEVGYSDFLNMIEQKTVEEVDGFCYDIGEVLHGNHHRTKGKNV